MTNLEILHAECLTRGIDEEVHTFSKWKQLGYKVKKGEKALFETKLWKMSNKKAEPEEVSEGDGQEGTVCMGRMYLAKSYLFGEHQVEKMEDK